MNYPKLIVVSGPTASGKTSLSLELAHEYNGEIISADSRQVFRGLDIGTGKVTESEMRGIPHHLIDILDPGQKYSVYQFQKDCLELIKEISSRGKLPIVVGGTGLYIESIVEQYQFNDQDKKSTKKLGLRPNTLVINLLPDRETIKNNIQDRLLERWNNHNMLSEVESLINEGKDKSWLKSLGLEYKYITEYIDGEFESEQAMLTKLNTESWRFAKRQITFNKRWSYAFKSQSNKDAQAVVKKFLGTQNGKIH